MTDADVLAIVEKKLHKVVVDDADEVSRCWNHYTPAMQHVFDGNLVSSILCFK